MTSQIYLTWKEAKDKRSKVLTNTHSTSVQERVKWKKPEIGSYKLNVDAAIKLGDPSFSMGMVLRDQTSAFVTCKMICRAMVSSVVEAEAQTILEGLQWLLTMNYDRVNIESDSLKSVRAIHSPDMNLLEVGFFIDACRLLLDAKVGFSVSFIKRQANRVAHLVAKLPCSMNCQNVITAPSNMLLESLMYDVSS
ncbi:uncharacterized protein LOC141685409 [Apium graveolens]|uniref:uncharacterized protein LOC141685409 n=1 Tax=Apium graveolens TaxID=4045 RepID=UPI003D794DFC